MFSWFGFETQKEQQPQQKPLKNGQGEKLSMITSKVSPTVKSTSVSVIVDEVVNNFNLNKRDSFVYSEPESLISNEPLRSASISLSIELAKKSSMSSLNGNKSKPIPFAQKPDTITPHSSLPKSMAIQKKQRPPSSIASNSSNSLLQRMAHSPKASAAAFPTSVSANGNAYYNKHEEEHENARSAAIDSLTKRMPTPTVNSDIDGDGDDDDDDEEDGINDTPATTTTSLDNDYFDNQKDQLQTVNNQQKQQQIIDDTEQEETIISPTLSTCENEISTTKQDKGGFWSWIGFSSHTETIVEQDDTLNATKTAENIEQKTQITTQQEVIVTPDIQQDNTQQETSQVIKQPNIIEEKNTSWTSYFYSSKQTKVVTIQDDAKKKNPSPAPAPVSAPAKVKRTSSLPTPDTVKPPMPSQTLRLSASTSSFHPRKKNQVLPPFDSQFIQTETPEIVTPTNNNNNIITKAIEAINSILIQPPPDQPEDTSNWIAKRMRAKFSSFVEDMKSSDPKTIVDKRIVVVGVHGWFPMKVNRKLVKHLNNSSLFFFLTRNSLSVV
ncbi:hypothetical protein BDF21DRAFT_38871 [Thamnidium elegans]|nr:hypothetical protein BDF21DRAFT_38871 [Thamnidium elegans]